MDVGRASPLNRERQDPARLQPTPLRGGVALGFHWGVRGQGQLFSAVTQLGPETPAGMWVGELVFPLQALYGPARSNTDCCFLK